MSTSICGYRGLVVALPCACKAGLCGNHAQVRICRGDGTYQFVSPFGRVDQGEIHDLKTVTKVLGLKAIRNCTKAEARFLEFDVDRKPKGPGEYVVFFQEQEDIPDSEGEKTMYYGVYKVVNFMKSSGQFGLDPIYDTNPFPYGCMPEYIPMGVKKTVMVIDSKEIGL